jgi:DNA-binding SARP family transcriptional activator
MLLSTSDWIGVDNRLFWSDTFAFLDGTTSPNATCIRSLRAVVDLYRGPFLDGFALPSSVEFEEWLAQERRVWETRFLVALQTLIGLDARGGNLAGAIDGAVRYLAIDPLAEEVHMQVMELYAWSGNRTAAMRQFTECISRLERELDASPLPQTTTLYEAIRDGLVPAHARVHASHAYGSSPPSLS